MEQKRKDEVRATLRALKADRGLFLARRLLQGLCDAIIEVDDSYMLLEDSRKLRGILVRAGTSDTLAEVCFVDLLEPCDRERFLSAFNDAFRYNEEVPLSLNVNLRCSYGTLAPVQIFFARFEGSPVSEAQCLIGIVELKDVTMTAEENIFVPGALLEFPDASLFETPWEKTPPRSEHSASSERTPGPIHEHSSSSHSSSCRSSSSDSQESQSSVEPKPLNVIIGAEPPFKLRMVSVDVVHILKTSSGFLPSWDNFDSWFGAEEQRATFQTWLFSQRKEPIQDRCTDAVDITPLKDACVLWRLTYLRQSRAGLMLALMPAIQTIPRHIKIHMKHGNSKAERRRLKAKSRRNH